MAPPPQPNLATSLTVEALGVAVEMRISGPKSSEVREALEHAWSRCQLPAGTPGQVSVNVDATRSPMEAAHLASSEVTVAAIEHRAGDLWMLHAAGLTSTEGRAVVLVAPSGTGKTTAAAYLGRRWGYLSDETIGIDADGRVLAYPKPLSVIEKPGRPKRQTSPDELGLATAPVDSHIVKIVLLTRRDDARLGVISLATGEAIVRLAAQSSYLRAMPTPLETMANHLRTTGGAVEVLYNDVSQLDDVLDKMLS